MYFILEDDREKFYIFYSLKKKVFHIIYNLSNHDEFY